jgi:GMP synthase (glutamine-hydrolysing)
LLLIVKTGTTLPELARRHGDFEDWICSGMGIDRSSARVVSVYRGHELPDPRDYAGVVVTGSSALVSEREDWSERSAAWLPSVLEARTPLLGICYGHQLLAHALGGQVARNPRGREVGTVDVRFTSDGDPLLSHLGERALVQASHVESVLELPGGARLLGGSEADPNHAFAVGELAWGIQFHPEFSAAVMRGYIDGRRTVMEAEDLDVAAIRRDTAESPAGGSVLRRFREIATLRPARSSPAAERTRSRPPRR